MGGLLEIGASILTQAERRAEVTAQNIANITTPGYKRKVSFESVMTLMADKSANSATMSTRVDLSTGKQIETGNPFDLAILGDGYFTLSGAEGPLYTRQGQFRLDADGRIVSTQGLPLQGAGGDIVLGSGPFEVTSDGVVLQAGRPIAQLVIAKVSDTTALEYDPSSFFRAPDEAVDRATGASIRQGALESSNVSPTDEMSALMVAVRRAETGQRIVGAYDELMGRALTAFGQD